MREFPRRGDRVEFIGSNERGYVRRVLNAYNFHIIEVDWDDGVALARLIDPKLVRCAPLPQKQEE